MLITPSLTVDFDWKFLWVRQKKFTRYSYLARQLLEHFTTFFFSFIYFKPSHIFKSSTIIFPIIIILIGLKKNQSKNQSLPHYIWKEKQEKDCRKIQSQLIKGHETSRFIDKLSILCSMRKSCSNLTYILLKLGKCVEKHATSTHHKIVASIESLLICLLL